MSSRLLTLDWRPRRLADVAGQKHVRVVLKQMILRKEVPAGLLFVGPRGTGKTSCGRILAAALNAPDGKGDVDVDNAHARAVADLTSLDVLEMDAASNGNIEDIRELQKRLLYCTVGAWRVVLLDEAHSMSREAFNALLKTLEEPPDQTVFVLLTTEPQKIPETVRSRCMMFEFYKLSVAEIQVRLKEICAGEQIEVDDSLLESIARRCDGGLRDAVMLLDQVRKVNICTGKELSEFLGEEDYAPGLLRAVMVGDVAESLRLLDAQIFRLGNPEQILDELSNCIGDCFIASGDVARTALFEEFGSKILQVARPLWSLRVRSRIGSLDSALRHAVFVACGTSTVSRPKVTKAARERPDLQGVREVFNVS